MATSTKPQLPASTSDMNQKIRQIEQTVKELEAGPHIEQKTNNETMENCAICCVATGGGCFLLSFIGGFITFIVFSMIGVCSVSLRTTQNRCPESNLWVWSIIYTIHAIAGLIYGSKQTKSEDKNPIGIMCSLIIVLGFYIWGMIDYWGVSCVDNLSNLLLYKLAFVQLIIGICVFGGLMIGLISICIKQCFCAKK